MYFQITTMVDEVCVHCKTKFIMQLSTPKFVEDWTSPDGYIYDAHLFHYTLRLECIEHEHVVYETVTEPVSTSGIGTADTGIFENMAFDILVHRMMPRLVRMCVFAHRLQDASYDGGWSGVIKLHDTWSRTFVPEDIEFHHCDEC